MAGQSTVPAKRSKEHPAVSQAELFAELTGEIKANHTLVWAVCGVLGNLRQISFYGALLRVLVPIKTFLCPSSSSSGNSGMAGTVSEVQPLANMTNLAEHSLFMAFLFPLYCRAWGWLSCSCRVWDLEKRGLTLS